MIDFIDMKSREDRKKVGGYIGRISKNDPKATVVDMINIVEVTRMKNQEAII